MTLRIAIIAPYDHTKIYGNTLRAKYLAEYLTAHNKVVDTYCFKPPTSSDRSHIRINKGLLSILPSWLRFRNLPFLFDFPFFQKVSINNNADLVIVENYYTYLILPQKKNFKVIIDYHSLKSEEMDRRGLKFIFKPIVELIEKKGLHASDHIIVASENIKDLIQRKFEIDSSRISVVHNSVDPNEYLKNQYRDDFKVGIIGPFLDGENLACIPHIEKLAASIPEVVVLVGTLQPEHKRKLQRHENIEILGELTVTNYQKFFEKIGAIFLPYFNNSMGGGIRNKLLESAASGTPIISTLSGARGFGTDNILIVESIEEASLAIEALKNSVELRRKLGNNLLKSLHQNHSFKTEAHKISSLVSQLKLDQVENT
ncbi:MAG: glycosyltransferase family 4 protein [Cyclobacteriaceae bacterium]